MSARDKAMRSAENILLIWKLMAWNRQWALGHHRYALNHGKPYEDNTRYEVDIVSLPSGERYAEVYQIDETGQPISETVERYYHREAGSTDL